MIVGLWILHKGILLFKKGDTNYRSDDRGILPSKKGNSDRYDECLSGILQALWDVCKKGMKETLSQFTTNKHLYHVHKRGVILVVGRFDTYTSLKEIQYQLSSIAKQFLKLYPKKVIIESSHKTSIFSSFGKHIKTKRDLLGDKIDSLWRVKSEYLECY